MFLDALGLVSDAQVIATGPAVSTNVIDLGASTAEPADRHGRTDGVWRGDRRGRDRHHGPHRSDPVGCAGALGAGRDRDHDGRRRAIPDGPPGLRRDSPRPADQAVHRAALHRGDDDGDGVAHARTTCSRSSRNPTPRTTRSKPRARVIPPGLRPRRITTPERSAAHESARCPPAGRRRRSPRRRGAELAGRPATPRSASARLKVGATTARSAAASATSSRSAGEARVLAKWMERVPDDDAGTPHDRPGRARGRRGRSISGRSARTGTPDACRPAPATCSATREAQHGGHLRGHQGRDPAIHGFPDRSGPKLPAFKRGSRRWGRRKASSWPRPSRSRPTQAPMQEEKEKFTAPCIRSPWFVTDDNYPRDKATFERDSGGFFGASSPATRSSTPGWRRSRSPPSAGTDPVIGTEPVKPISARRWL